MGQEQRKRAVVSEAAERAEVNSSKSWGKQAGGNSIPQLRSSWQIALRALTNSTANARNWIDARYCFTSQVARQLVGPIAERESPAVIYAVWLEGDHEQPVYVGQSMEPARRLWDLPIGESHHLANSFPPEIWRVVAVEDWATSLRGQPELEARVFEQLAERGIDALAIRQTIALGVEFRLQQTLHPLINLRKKLRDGAWRNVDFERSRSAGAVVSRLPSLIEFSNQIAGSLTRRSMAETESQASESGWAVFPAKLFAETIDQ